MIKVYAVIF